MLALITSSLTATADAARTHGPTKARLVQCAAAVGQPERFAVFTAEIRSLAAGASMQVRMTLQARTPGSRFKRVRAPGFGAWNTASPGVRRYVYTKRIEGLLAPASYRVAVKYRWLDSGGRVIRRDSRRTRSCHQPDERPDLVPLRIGIGPGQSAETRTYLVPVLNRGLGDAGAFSVALTVNGLQQPAARVTGLPAGVRTVLAIEAPVCARGSTLSVRVDSGSVIDEADEADNTRRAACRAG